MPQLGWKEATVEVLRNSTEPMHYADIAEAIVEGGFRAVGATPATTVAKAIRNSLKYDGDDSPFVRVSRGYYALKEAPNAVPEPEVESEEEQHETTGLINAFGMYWARDRVLWVPRPKILGQQQMGSTAVDFYEQKGVYLLYDGRAVVYVGRTTDQPLGLRLRQHIFDRLNGRWNRFSWFGVYPVTETGAVKVAAGGPYTPGTLIATMEALLIEGLEPPQNRKRGDDFRAIEFLQAEDPDIQRDQNLKLMDELKKKL